MFVAASLLVVVASGVAAQAVGLSMSLGALIAGLLLAPVLVAPAAPA